MSLIEKLGGYDSAKRYAESRKGADDESVYLALCNELLEHRRENNIFEVGDWVYPLERILDEHEGVGRFILVEKGELIMVREVKQKGLYVSHEHRHDNSFYVYFNEIRHATPEEIKAGHRL